VPTRLSSYNQVDYQKWVGKLMYTMIGTRPDLAFTVATLAKFTSAPTAQHFAACKRVMRYLQGTASYGLLYSNKSYCVGYTDSDYGGDKYNRKSTFSTLAERQLAGKSRQQSIVALSTMEAEYIAATEASKELI